MPEHEHVQDYRGLFLSVCFLDQILICMSSLPNISVVSQVKRVCLLEMPAFYLLPALKWRAETQRLDKQLCFQSVLS